METPEQNGDYIKEIVKRGIQFEINAEFERQKEEMIKNLDRRKDEIISGILLGVMKSVQINSVGETTTFVIRKLDGKS